MFSSRFFEHSLEDITSYGNTSILWSSDDSGYQEYQPNFSFLSATSLQTLNLNPGADYQSNSIYSSQQLVSDYLDLDPNSSNLSTPPNVTCQEPTIRQRLLFEQSNGIQHKNAKNSKFPTSNRYQFSADYNQGQSSVIGTHLENQKPQDLYKSKEPGLLIIKQPHQQENLVFGPLMGTLPENKKLQDLYKSNESGLLMIRQPVQQENTVIRPVIKTNSENQKSQDFYKSKGSGLLMIRQPLQQENLVIGPGIGHHSKNQKLQNVYKSKGPGLLMIQQPLQHTSSVIGPVIGTYSETQKSQNLYKSKRPGLLMIRQPLQQENSVIGPRPGDETHQYLPRNLEAGLLMIKQPCPTFRCPLPSWSFSSNVQQQTSVIGHYPGDHQNLRSNKDTGLLMIKEPLVPEKVSTMEWKTGHYTTEQAAVEQMDANWNPQQREDFASNNQELTAIVKSEPDSRDQQNLTRNQETGLLMIEQPIAMDKIETLATRLFKTEKTSTTRMGQLGSTAKKNIESSFGFDQGTADALSIRQVAVEHIPKIRKKRVRTIFTERQLDAMMARFKLRPDIGPEERKMMAKELGLTADRIRHFFFYRKKTTKAMES